MHIEEKNIPNAIRAPEDACSRPHFRERPSTPGKGNVRWPENFDTPWKRSDHGCGGLGLALKSWLGPKIWRKMYDTEEQLAADALAFMKAKCQCW
jgi:D-psicose/D-tagatose/L-ribulose 3-epimerase